MVQVGRAHVRIRFDLPVQEEGYPPVRHESLWAIPQGEGRFIVDNIPFYVRGVSSGDVVLATRTASDEWSFREVVIPSRASTFRLYVLDPTAVQAVRDKLRDLGCTSELSDIPNLIAVEVPGETSIAPFLDYIVAGAEDGRWEYQEATLRHPLPS